MSDVMTIELVLLAVLFWILHYLLTKPTYADGWD
jgi:hypothetical protein